MKTAIKIVVLWLIIHTIVWIFKMYFAWEFCSYIWWINKIPYDDLYRGIALVLNLAYAICIYNHFNPDKE